MYLLGLRYLEALPQITAGAGTTIFLPTEATGVMGALGGIRELLASQGRGAGAAAAAKPGFQPPKPAPTLRSLLDPTSGGKTEG
jgi:hypothetical protein